jgi:glycosyltransferase involved in cell wall biosynthesis
LAQECDFEIHITIHDDCSTDNTVQIIHEVMKNSQYSWQILTPSKNQFSQGRDFLPRLLSTLKSDFIAILEGDDYWTDSGKLQLQAEALIANQNASICHHTFSVYESDKMAYEWPPEKWKCLLPGAALAEENFIGTLTTMFRKSELPKDFGPGFNELSIADYPIWSLIADGKEIAFVDRNMATYRIHNSNYWAHGSSEEKAMQALRAKIYITSMVQVENSKIWIDAITAQLNAETKSELAASQQELAASQQELAASQQELAASQQELAHSSELNEKFGVESESLKHQIAILDQELQIKKNTIESMYKSFSWRITSPIRRIAALLKSSRNR